MGQVKQEFIDKLKEFKRENANLEDNKTSFILLIGKTQERIKNLVINGGYQQRAEFLKVKNFESFQTVADKQLMVINRKCEEIVSLAKHCLNLTNARFDELISMESEQD